MPRPKKPEEVRRKVIELGRAGHSSRQIEAIMERDGTPVDHATAAALVTAARVEAMRSSAPPRGAVEATEVDPDAIPDLDLRGLYEMSTLFQTKIQSALDVGDALLAGKLLDGRITVAREVARLRPPVPPDPTKDPANVAARDELRARLERLRAASVASEPAREQVRAYLEGPRDPLAKHA